MIFGNIKQLEMYTFLPEAVKNALLHAEAKGLFTTELGRHQLEAEDLSYNRLSYETKDEQLGFWEAHKNHIDLHIVIKGQEKINVNFTNNLNFKYYHTDRDLMSFSGRRAASIIMKAGDFLVCYPKDAHMTSLKTHKTGVRVEKIIYKIKID